MKTIAEKVTKIGFFVIEEQVYTLALDVASCTERTLGLSTAEPADKRHFCSSPTFSFFDALQVRQMPFDCTKLTTSATTFVTSYQP